MTGMLTWLVPVAAIALGIAAIVVGLRGRRTDDHPVCRKCGRDLFGLAELPPHCPECGRALGPGAVRHGNRARRVGLATVGAFVAVPGALWLAGAGALAFGGTSMDPYKPIWLLAREADGDLTCYAAAGELGRRMTTGELDATEVNDLVERFLADQADAGKYWRLPKGDFIELCEYNAKLAPRQWQRYVVNGVAPALAARELVRRGAPIPLRLEGSKMRLGSSSAVYTGSTAFSGGGGLPVEFNAVIRGGDGTGPSLGTTWVEVADASTSQAVFAAQLPVKWPQVPGAVTDAAAWVQVTISAMRVDRSGRRYVPMAPAAEDAAAWQPMWPNVRILPPGQPAVELVDSPALASALRRAFRGATARVALPDWYRVALAGGREGAYAPPEADVLLELDMANVGPELPPACYGVFLDGGAGAQRVGELRWDVATRGSRVVRGKLDGSFNYASADRARLVLRPDAEAAEQTFELTAICGSELVLEDVPIAYPDWYAPHRERLAKATPASAPPPPADEEDEAE